METPKKSPFLKSLIRWIMIILGIKIIIISFFMLHFLEKTKSKKPEACYQKQCFQLEVANTPEKRELWLMFRDSFPKNQGMLFIFDKSDFWSFWMRNTLVPLDIIWLNEENKIVDIVSAPPCTEMPCPSYLPQAQATKAIEFNSWTAKEIWLWIGGSLDIKNSWF